MPDLESASLLAAIDLGSNSFRLEICKVEHGQLLRVEYLKDTVRLGARPRRCTPARRRGDEPRLDQRGAFRRAGARP